MVGNSHEHRCSENYDLEEDEVYKKNFLPHGNYLQSPQLVIITQ